MPKFIITSEHLQALEPYLEKYYDFHSTMLFDEIKQCVENSGIDYITQNDNGGLSKVDYDETFRKHEELKFIASYPQEKLIQDHKQLSQYFTKDDNDEIIGDDAMVLFALTYMSYIYYKEKNNKFSDSVLIEALNLEYDIVLQKKIYPEILSLYRMILESKTKKNRNSKVTITYKQDKFDINAHSWFLDDMEKYFADRFPTLTIDKINEILPQYKGKAGIRFTDRAVTNLIWGTYHLANNHLSKYKDSKAKVSTDVCRFVACYLEYLDVCIDEDNIRESLKDMIKRNFAPKWNLPWRNYLSRIEEKQPENILGRPQQRYLIQ